MNEVKLKIGGIFHFECFDKDGNFKWANDAINAVVTEGRNHILDVEFHATAASATWYIGLIKTAYVGDPTDTMASHAGWTEAVLTTDYTGNRKEWTEGAAAAGVTTNAATVDFAMLTTITVKGALLTDAATGTAGKLFCTAAFTGGDQAVNNGDTLKVTYTITATAV
jgi:hypothetical protein